MSLRSGSPCTSTSRPRSSCSLMTSAISCFIRRSYSASSISPATSAARALRIVDGLRERADRRGRQRRQVQPRVLTGAPLCRVAAVRTGRDDRVDAGPDLVVVQARVLLAGGDGGVGRRDLVGDRFATLVAARAPERPPRATFSAPNASQLRNASSRPVSGSSEYGTCSVEHDVETATLAAEPSRVASLPSAASRSVRQMLRPSTTPATSVLLASSGTAATAVLPP